MSLSPDVREALLAKLRDHTVEEGVSGTEVVLAGCCSSLWLQRHNSGRAVDRPRFDRQQHRKGPTEPTVPQCDVSDNGATSLLDEF